jgi:predicted MPP superfamily phosphohydrolase
VRAWAFLHHWEITIGLTARWRERTGSQDRPWCLRCVHLPIQDGKDKFWLVGFDSQDGQTATARSAERHDPERSFADVPVGASVILMAHEPDYFAKGDARPSLQISGHTHAGQLNLFGWRPLTPSRYGGRFAHGLVSEAEGRLIVSAGLGYSGLPLRIGAPSEISVVYLTGTSG